MQKPTKVSKTQQKALEEKSNDYSELENIYYRANGSTLSDPFMAPSKIVLSKELTVTVVIPAGNVKSSILACLASIEQSSFNFQYPDRLQVVVVDDGSTDGTWDIIKSSHCSLNLTAVRQKHHGQAQALNTGICISEGEIIICCDADMVLSYYTIEHFVNRHQQLSNVLLVGFRSDTPADDLRISPKHIRKNGSHQYSYFLEDERIKSPVPGWPNNMCLASDHFKNLGYFRGLWMSDDPWLLSDMVFGALFSLPKSTYCDIGGYDERFVGWGCTDGYLASKAIAAGNFVVPVYSASGLHISHLARSKTKQLEYERNRKLFMKLIKTSKINNYPSWFTKAKDRIIEYFNPLPSKLSSTQNKERPDSLEPEYREIDTLLAIGEYSNALSLLLRESSWNDKSFLLRLGKAQFGMKKYKEAINTFKEIFGSTSEAVVQLAVAQAADNQFLAARKTLKQFALRYPDAPILSYWYYHPVQKHIQQGLNYFNQGFYDVALRVFEAVLITDPNSKTALEYRHQCIGKQEL